MLLDLKMINYSYKCVQHAIRLKTINLSLCYGLIGRESEDVKWHKPLLYAMKNEN